MKKDSLSWKLFSQFCGGDPTHTKEYATDEFISLVSDYFAVEDWTKSSCIARFPPPVNVIFHTLLKGDILVKAIKT